MRTTLLLAGIAGVGFIALFTYLLWNIFFSSQPKPSGNIPTPSPLRRVTPGLAATRIPTRTVSRPPVTSPSPEPPYPTEAFPDQTGGHDFTLDDQQAKIVEQKYRLRTSLPVRTATFEISYDYRTFVYIVTFFGIDPATGKQQFTQWLKTNGYTALTLDMFEFR